MNRPPRILCLGLLFHCLFFGYAQSPKTIDESFISDNGFYGSISLETTFYLENSYKIKVSLKRITILGFKTSIGDYKANELASEGIVFPLDCTSCSLNLKGVAGAYSTEKNKNQTLPFQVNEPLFPDAVVILNIPLPVPIDEAKYQLAKRDWENRNIIENLSIFNLEGSALSQIVNSVKLKAQYNQDMAKLNVLIEELIPLEKSKRLQKLYASRSQFYNKKLVDSIMTLVKKDELLAVSKPQLVPESSHGSTSQTIAENLEVVQTTQTEQVDMAPKSPTEAKMTSLASKNLAQEKEEQHDLNSQLASHIDNCANRIEDLNQQKASAIAEENFLKANDLKKELETLHLDCKEREDILMKAIENNKKNCKEELTSLNIAKENAIVKEDYLKAAAIKKEMDRIESDCTVISKLEAVNDSPIDVSSLEVPIATPTASNTAIVHTESNSPDDIKTKEIISPKKTKKKRNTGLLSIIAETKAEASSQGGPDADANLSAIMGVDDSSNNEVITLAKLENEEKSKKSRQKASKISKSDFDFSSDLKNYKRSSLHTIMLQNPGAEQADVIESTFLNRPLPEKFNTHHITTNFISVARKARKQDKVITEYLERNNIAKDLVAQWFNRNDRGEFNMDLVAERGHYNASVFDVNIAKKSERGLAMLADAGESLIANTFVIVNDYKYTNKEEVAKKAGWLSSLTSAVANAAGASDVALVADAVTVGTAVAGKGYVVKTTSYLYRLVWNEKMANIFYNDYWIDANTFDPNKKTAFDKSDIFELELVGYESIYEDVQSSAFTSKSDAELIERATVKATDKAIAKLQRSYEIFRPKTPLISTEPLAAKIGLKEGLEKGDKFEVLEQYLNDDGTVGMKRMGVIKVNSNHIWDNRYKATEENDSTFEYTTFSGAKNKFYQGMLIRQIN